MKQQNIIKMLIFAGLVSIANIQANPNIATLPDISELQDACESVLTKALKQLKDINVMLEDLALTVNNNAIRQVRNRRALVDEIKSIRNLIDKIVNDAHVQVNEYSLAFLIHFTHELTAHINAALDEGLTNLKHFDVEAILNWQPKKMPTVENLQKKLDKNEKLLESVKTKAQSAGLCWYNKFYRTFDKYVIQPADKHDLGARGKFLLAGGAVASLVWFYSNGQPEKGSFTEWLRGWVGYGPKTANGDPDNLDTKYHVNENHPMKQFGNLSWWVIKNSRGNMPGLNFAMTAFVATFWKECGNLKEAFDKKMTKLTSFLKGGTYASNQMVSNEERIEPRYTFDDLVGCEHVKEVLSFVVKYIEDPERFDRAQLTPEKGYLLTGPTRTGKSMTAEALAGEIKKMLKKNGRNADDFGFYHINSTFIAQNGIGYYLDLAKSCAPCILFVDEIDLLSLQRAGDRKLLSEFLSSMSGVMEKDPKKQVILLAATNKPENMDEALRQRGRFGKELRFDYPTFSERKDFLIRRLEKLSVNLNSFDIDKIARETECFSCWDNKGTSYEDLNAVIKGAFQRAKVWGEVLTQYHLERSLDEEVRNIISAQNLEMPDSQKHLIAVHQAGHALATALLGGKYKLAKVTIKPILAKLKEELVWDQYYVGEDQKQKKIIFGKTFTFCEPGAAQFLTREDRIDQCSIQLAGHMAEKIMLGSSGYSYHAEEPGQTFNMAKAIVSEGLDLQQMTEPIRTKYLEKALALKKECEESISDLLQKHKDVLEAVAAALEKYKTLNHDEVEALIKDPKAELRKPINLTTEQQAMLREIRGEVPQPATSQQITSATDA